MTIDLREEFVNFRNYVSRLIEEHLRKAAPKPGMIHVVFTFDQDGWVKVYFDTRLNAFRDGEWSTHLQPETLLLRPHWHEAAELGDLVLIGTNGNQLQEWDANPTFQNLVDILGEFLRSSISIFEAEGLFKPILGRQKLNFCVEEFDGYYGWPLDPELAKLIESLKSSSRDSDSRSL